jgi:hypothetical protein
MQTDRIFFIYNGHSFEWIKITSMCEESGYINYIFSKYLNKIINIDVSSIDKYMRRIIVSQRDGIYIMDYSRLDEPHSDEYQKRQDFPYLFKSFRDQINSDFNGDEELFFRHKKWEDVFIPPNKIDYNYKYMTIKKFNNLTIIIPYSDIDKYSELFPGIEESYINNKKLFLNLYQSNILTNI